MNQESLSLREVLAFYYRYRPQLLRAFIAPFLFFIVVSFIPTPRFEASSVLIVRLGSEFVYQPEVATNTKGAESAIPFDRDQIFKSEVAILNSDDLHAQVIKDETLEKLYPEILHPNAIVQILQTVTQPLHNLLVTLGILPTLSPEQIEQRKLAKALLRFDKRLDITLEKESAVITVSFQHADATVATETLDRLLQLYMEKRKQLYLEPRAELAQKQVMATHEKAAATEQALDSFKRDHKIYSLSDQRSSLLQARAEIDRKRASVTSEGLDEKIAFFNRQLDLLDAQERDYNRLEHEKQIAEEEYASASHQLNESMAFEDLQRERAGSVRIIQPPSTPPEPKRWQFLIILAGFFAAFFSMLAKAAWLEFSGTGFLTPERLERRLGVSVLGVVSSNN